jgi:putative hydrolase of the HAD superfamily
MNRPAGLLFDYFDTLVGDVFFDYLAGSARVLELAVDRRGHTPESVQVAARELEDALGPLRRATPFELTSFQFQRLLYDGLGIRFRVCAEALESEFWRAAVRCTPEPGIDRILAWVHRQGLRAAGVRNTTFSTDVLTGELERHGLMQFVEFVVSSADYGIRKPHRLLFGVALARLGPAPSQVWFAGDSLAADVAGGRGAGMATVWYNRRAEPPGETRPDAEIAAWPELVALIERHRT